MLKNVREATEIMEKIVRASSEQSSDIDQINRSIVTLESGTVANSSEAEELAATLKLLTEQSAELANVSTALESALGSRRSDEESQYMRKGPRGGHSQPAPSRSTGSDDNRWGFFN